MRIIGARILVEPEVKETTAGGFSLPQEEQDKGQAGKVINVGSGCENDVKVGDRIVFDRNMLLEYTVDGSKYHVIEEEDVLGVM